MVKERTSPFRLDFSESISSPMLSRCVPLMERVTERALALSRLHRAYLRIISENPTLSFVDSTLKVLEIDYTTSGLSLDDIPATGPLVVVSNHPYGGAEGVILLSLLNKRRLDAKVLGNSLLTRIPEFAENVIPVNPFGGTNSIRANLAPLRQALSWLKEGSALGVFPAGTVSHFQWRQRGVSDPKWSPMVARIIRESKATVLPLFIGGKNGLLFQLLGMLHPRLRTAMLVHELCKKKDTVPLIIGTPVPYSKLADFRSDEEMIDHLRLRTYLLGSVASNSDPADRSTGIFRQPRKLKPVAPPKPASRLAEEIDSLPKEQLLVEQGEFLVGYAQGTQVPNVIQEIGRLREVTFREVQEGTGRPLDLDRFDDYYFHLFSWDRKERQIVGAYRVVDVDHALQRFGLKGLYTHTLFDYDSRLLAQMGPSLEVGRSFIRSEYQKNYSSLHLLWKGIANYVLRNPVVHGLFGTVSINSEYDSVSRQLIIAFLKANNYFPEMAKMIRARNPLKGPLLPGLSTKEGTVVARDLKEVSELLAEIKSKQKSVPVLLRQYLKLGGKLLGFNVDKTFGNVLDGLIYVDLRETDPTLLQRFMGKNATVNYLKYHSRLSVNSASRTSRRFG